MIIDHEADAERPGRTDQVSAVKSSLDCLLITSGSTYTFMLIESWKPNDPSYNPSMLQGSKILHDLKQRAAKFSTNLSLIWQSIPEGTKCWHSRLSSWVPQPWDNRDGTVTLLGDAAHP